MVSEIDISRFLSSGNGNGYGYGNGNGNGYGIGIGIGYGNGYGNGIGYGNGYGNGYGDGYGYGNGNGNGYGYGIGDGYGNGYGYGNGNGNGYGISELAGYKMYNIDSIPTAFESIFGNYAEGYTVEHNTVLAPCYIAKVNGFFAHGETLHEAEKAARGKYEENRPIEERLEDFVKSHPELDTPYDDLFSWHHILTGSCEYGRRQWCKNRGVSPDGSFTVRWFIENTVNDYGGDVIRQLKDEYGL